MPDAFYADIRGKCPVRHEEGIGWLISRYHDVRSMALNTKEFSSSIAGEEGPRHMGVGTEPLSEEVEGLLAQYHPMDNALFTADPPKHTRHRALVNKGLNPRRVRSLEGKMREISEDLVDGFIADGHCELHTQFGIGLPLTVIADTLGVERKDMPEFKYWSDCMLAGNLDVLDNTRRAEIARAVIDFQQYFIPRIESRRKEPQDDLLSDLANAEIEDGDLDGEATGPRNLTTAELLPIVSQILLAGNETTTNLIGNGLVILIRNPEIMAEVRGQFSLIPGFVEEVLRFDGPIHCTFRRTMDDVEVDGEVIPGDSMVVPVWGSANKDPEVFDQPEKFDIHRRNARRHLTFGVGPHFCVGAEMARLEAKVGFETLLTRLDNIRLKDDAGLAHYPSFSARGFQRIDIEFDPAG
ncbi:MAG TPA: cytochrome P450 [Solirubrobacterales bacterium]|nr:cytochrome P450 [Solirubrobacterales bacterium]